MSVPPDGPSAHDEAQQLLPWWVNGRLSAPDAARFAAHLNGCAECRADVEAERRIRSSLRQSPRVEYAPQASFQKLWSRIEEVELDVPTRPPDDESMVRPARRSSTSRHWRIAAAVAMGVGVGLLFAAPWRMSPTNLPATYTTASQPGPVSARSVQIRAVFSPAMTVDELTRIVRETRLAIVEGPSESGVYGLATVPRSAAAAQDALARLRADPRVRFAEPVSTE
jgi:anti-sigma factor RsiW